MSLMIKETPLEERPREKYKQNGFERLSDADLIAILIRTGTKNMSAKELATHILKNIESLEGLNETSLETLGKIKGVGEVKAITLLTALELGRRALKNKIIKEQKISTAKDLYELFAPNMQTLSQEHLVAVFLNNKNCIINYKTIFKGSANKSIVSPRDIYKEALKYSAVKLMIIHNHPSGDPTPSKEDLAFTTKMSEVGEILEIPLLDHLIIGKNKYYSFYDHRKK